MNKFILLIVLLISVSFETRSQEKLNAVPAIEALANFPKIRDFTMSLIAKEAYVTIQSPLEELAVIARLKLVDGIWAEPEIASFSGEYKDLEPFLAPDGLRLYFVSNRPLNDSTSQPKDIDIWYVERENLETNWSEPINIEGPVNTEFDEFYPSVASNNNLYFTRESPETKGKDDIFYSEWDGKGYKTPVSMSTSINSESYEFNSYISPDEAYIIYSGYNRIDGFGSGDLYISFKDEEGNWSKSKNLGGEINSAQMDYCPYVDLNAGILYFTSRRSTINTKGRFDSVASLDQEINKYENGYSRIYKVPIASKISGTQVK
jgi:hypothetical protein